MLERIIVGERESVCVCVCVSVSVLEKVREKAKLTYERKNVLHAHGKK